MNRLAIIIIAAALQGCSVAFQPPESIPTEGYQQTRIVEYEATGNIGTPMGVADAYGKARGCVVTHVGEPVDGTLTLRQGDCTYTQP